MKTFQQISLCFFIAIVLVTAHIRQSSRPRGYRAIGSIMQTTCKNVCDKTDQTHLQQKPWSIDVSHVGISIGHSVTHSALVLVNHKLSVAILLSHGGIGFFNLKLHKGFLVNGFNSGVKVVKNCPVLKGPVLSYIEELGALFQGHINFTPNPLHIIPTLLQIGQIFAHLIKNIAVNILTNIFKFVKNGIIALLKIFLGTFAAITMAFTGLLLNLINSIGAFLNAKFLFHVFHNALYFTSAIVKKQITLVTIGADMCWHFFKLGVHLFSVTVDGFVVIKGRIVGTLANAAAILKGVVGEITAMVHVKVGVAVVSGIGVSYQPLISPLSDFFLPHAKA